MNEELNYPSIEPQLEARIIALVLGEASEFESDELHRLIDERPELALFKKQMQSVHGLLKEVSTGEFVEKDEDWKLPAQRRNAVLAVIRGEATVQTSASGINESVHQEVPGERGWRWNMTKVAAVVCVVGFFGVMSLPVYFNKSIRTNQETQWGLSLVDNSVAPSSKEAIDVYGMMGGTRFEFEYEDGRAGTDVKQPQSLRGLALGDDSAVVSPTPMYSQSTLNGWSSSTLEFDDSSVEFEYGRPATDVKQPQSQIAWSDNKKNSEAALSAIRGTLGADATLPGSYSLKDDFQFLPVQPELNVPENQRKLNEQRIDKNHIVDQPASARQALDDALPPTDSNKEKWFFKGISKSQSAAPSTAEGDLSFPLSTGIGGEVSGPEIAAIRLRTGVADREAVLLDALGSLSAAEQAGKDGESDAPLSAKLDGLAELSVSGRLQGNQNGSATLGLADIPLPESKSIRSRRGKKGFQTQTTRPEPGRGQQQLSQSEDESLNFRMEQSSPPTNNIMDRVKRFSRESELREDFDVAGTTEAAGEQKDKSLGNRFEDRGELQSDTAVTDRGGFGGGGGFGSGSGFGLNSLSDDRKSKIQSGAEGIVSRELKSNAGLNDSGQGASTQAEGFGEQHFGKSNTTDFFVKKSLESLHKAIELPAPASVTATPVRGGRVLGEGVIADGKSEKVSAESPEDGAELHDKMTQDNIASFSIQTPVPVTGATVVPSYQVPSNKKFKVEGGKNVEKIWEKLPSKQKKKQVELQRESRSLGQSIHLFGYSDLHTRLDSTDSMKLPAIKRIAPAANLNEKSAEDEAFSTFSLHVSDVSFKLALAALTRGEWPEAAKVRIEEFVNAFDYGDPTPRNGDKVACYVEQSIHPFVQQRNMLRVSMKTAAAGRSSNTPLRLTFLLDNSGSMERIDRQQTVRRAFALLAHQLTPIDQVTLISFARQPRLLADKVGGGEAGKLVKIVDELPSEGGTNIEAALQLAFEKAREQQLSGAQNRIVLLTDGAVNLGDANPENLSQMVTTMRNSGIAFDAAGIIADGLNDEVLEALTRKGDGRYYLLDSLEAADDGFARQIAGALRPAAKNVKVQIEFNPKRVGHYKLLGFEKHILKQEDFRNDKVDAAEMAAAEAGVALYQFEAKPDGEGDVGSVSVRFRDLSTGQMIENRWPIPYESDAPRPDQSAPSLRIATSAALLAAKLRGDPLGETVDLQTLSNLISGLPDQDRNNVRIQQLQMMIGQARQLSGK